MVTLKDPQVAFVSVATPASKSSWSGVPYFAFRSLRAHFPNLTHVASPKIDLALRVMNKAARKMDVDLIREDLSSVAFAKSLETQFHRSRPDLIIGIAASHMLARLQVDVPIIHFSDATFRAMVDYYPGRFSRLKPRTIRHGDALEARMIHKAAAVVFSSQWACRSAINDYGADPSKVFCVPMGANFDTDPGDRKTLTRDTCRLLFVGVDWHRKGGDIALLVTRELRARGVNVELHVVGCEPPPEAAGPELVRHGFLDKRDPRRAAHLDALFRSATFFLLPSRSEAFGIVFAEASSYGLPSVAIATGGIPSAIEDNVNGLLMPLGATAEHIAERIALCWADREAYASLCTRTRKRYVDVLNWTVWGDSIAQIARPLLLGPA